MHKVVVERPRWNPGPNKNDRRAQLPEEFLPKFEGIRRPYRDHKGFTDLLGPLRRWLLAQVGRPWNEVYSEACAVIKPDSVVRAHIRTHLLEFVERHTFIQDGEVCALYGNTVRPVREMKGRWQPCYVHPETGLLMVIADWSRRERRTTYWPEKIPHFRWLGEQVGINQVKGIWYAYYFREVPGEGPFTGYDHLAGEVVGRGGLQQRKGRYWQCFRKQQLSRRELQRFGLKNAPSLSGSVAIHSCCGVKGWLRSGRLANGRQHSFTPTKNPQPWRSYAAPHPAI